MVDIEFINLEALSNGYTKTKLHRYLCNRDKVDYESSGSLSYASCNYCNTTSLATLRGFPPQTTARLEVEYSVTRCNPMSPTTLTPVPCTFIEDGCTLTSQ